MTANLPPNMTAKIQITARGCWEWTGALNSRGYGQVGVAGVSRSTHRVAYELLVGPIPDGLTIDHLCLNKRCCNPEHLEPVTRAENIRRAARLITHCVRGHALAGDNLQTRQTKTGVMRVCKKCRRMHAAEWRARKRAALKAAAAVAS